MCKKFIDPKEALEFFKKSEAIHAYIDPSTSSICWSVGTFGDIEDLIDELGHKLSLYDAAWEAFEKMELSDMEIIENMQPFMEEYTQFIEQ